MKQEDKELLLRDICARLPYKVNIQVKEWATVDAELKTGHIDRLQHDEIEVKPYLRPMKSMTEEEKAVYSNYQILVRRIGLTFEYNIDYITEWLLQHHLDFRGLIEKGLALEAPEGMYNFK